MKIENQKEVFNDIKNLKYRLQGLAGYIQNDFDRMLDDNTINKEKIRYDLLEMNLQYDKFIKDINLLRIKADKILQHHSK